MYLFFANQKLALFGEAIAAINRTVISGLERNFCFASAGSADGREHFLLAGSAIFSGVAAGLASLGFVCEAFFVVEVLFACSKNEFRAAVFANKGFVLKHGFSSL